jgi:hypothetical protein
MRYLETIKFIDTESKMMVGKCLMDRVSAQEYEKMFWR